MSLSQDIAKARALADAIRADWPEKAEELDLAALAACTGFSEGLKVTLRVVYTLEKFEGEAAPDKQPYETVIGQG